MTYMIILLLFEPSTLNMCFSKVRMYLFFAFQTRPPEGFELCHFLRPFEKKKQLFQHFWPFFGWRKWPTCCFYFVSCSLCVLYPHVLYFQNYILQLGRPSYLNFKKQHLCSIPSTKNLKRVQLGKVYTTQWKSSHFDLLYLPNGFDLDTPPPKPTTRKPPKIDGFWVDVSPFSPMGYSPHRPYSPKEMAFDRCIELQKYFCTEATCRSMAGRRKWWKVLVYFFMRINLFCMEWIDGWIDRYIPSHFIDTYPPYNRGSWNYMKFIPFWGGIKVDATVTDRVWGDDPSVHSLGWYYNKHPKKWWLKDDFPFGVSAYSSGAKFTFRKDN